MCYNTADISSIPSHSRNLVMDLKTKNRRSPYRQAAPSSFMRAPLAVLWRLRLDSLSTLDHVIGIAVFVSAFLVYLGTVFPTVYPLNGANRASGAYTLGIVHPTGYPLWLLAGKLFTFLPFGEVAYRVNLRSGFMASLALLALYYALLELTSRYLVAASAALMLGFSFYFWREARAAEVYTMHTLFMAILLLVLFRWAGIKLREGRSSGRLLLGFAFLYGLSFSNHMSSGFLALGFSYLILVIGRRDVLKPSLIASMLFLFALGWLPYAYLPIRDMASPPINYARELDVDLTSLSGMWWMISGEVFKQFVFLYQPGDIVGEALKYSNWLWINFLGIGVVLGVLGIGYMALHERHLLVALLLLFIPGAVFFINYYVFDKDTMFLPTYVVWTIWLAKGLESIADRVRRLKVERHLNVSPAFSGLCLALIVSPLFVNFSGLDASDNYVVRQFAEDVLDNVENDSLIVADWITVTPLRYLQTVEGKRQDVETFYWFLYSQRRLPELTKQGIPLDQACAIVDSEMVDIIRAGVRSRAVYSIGGPPVFWNAFEMEPVGRYHRLREKTS